MSHPIRLRGPWHYRVLARTVRRGDGTVQSEPGELPPPGRTTVPGDWGDCVGPDFRGTVRYTRHFHRPTGLGPGEPIALVIDQVDAWAVAWINGNRLGKMDPGTGAARFDLTGRLSPDNELTIDVHLPRLTAGCRPLARPDGRQGLPGGLVGEVRLEIG